MAGRIYVMGSKPDTIMEELPVSFGRPREAGVKQRKESQGLHGDALARLPRAPGHGQVRVSV